MIQSRELDYRIGSIRCPSQKSGAPVPQNAGADIVAWRDPGNGIFSGLAETEVKVQQDGVTV